MKNNFVADGECRFLKGRKTSAAAIEKKYADKIARANPDEKLKLQEKMAQEHRMVLMTQNHKPSGSTLW